MSTENEIQDDIRSNQIAGNNGKISITALFSSLIFITLILCPPLLCANTKHPLAAADTISPRNTLRYFIDEMTDLDNISNATGYESRIAEEAFSEVVRCLDLSKTPPNQVGDVGRETVILLKEIFDRIELPPYDQIPDAEALQKEGLNYWVIPHTEIRFEKIIEGERKDEFLFSIDTVTRVKLFYKKVQHLPYKSGASLNTYEDYIYGAGPIIPQALFQRFPDWLMIPILEQAIWQWLGLVLSLGVASLIVITVFYQTQFHKKSGEKISFYSFLKRLSGPLVLMIMAYYVEDFVDEQINITGTVNTVNETVLMVISFVAAGWCIVVIVNSLTEILISSLSQTRSEINPNAIRIFSRLFVFVLLIVFFGFVTDFLGMPITATFASAGIVGIAIAFAARETQI